MNATETSTVAWGGTHLPYTIRRSARRKKTVAVTVDPAGTVLLVAPEHLTTDDLDGIVSRKAEWIAQRLRRAQSYGPPISPHWRIIQAPMRLVDYVVDHELVHLRHRGHGRDYWQAVGRVMPDYERRREDLRRSGVGLAW